MPDPMASLAERLHTLRHAIAEAAVKAGRDPGSVRLIAVSKMQSLEAVQEAIRAGQAAFGENYVQEAAGKFGELAHTPNTLERHLIGPLQTNKVPLAVRLFECIDTLDRESLAAALAKTRDKGTILPRLCVEVNIGREPQKAGILPEALGDFLDLCRDTYGLSIEGLMAVPPVEADPSPHFAALASLAKRHDLPRLSMGMSHDFQEAIRYGATEVRIGTALFGPRHTS